MKRADRQMMLLDALRNYERMESTPGTPVGWHLFRRIACTAAVESARRAARRKGKQ